MRAQLIFVTTSQFESGPLNWVVTSQIVRRDRNVPYGNLCPSGHFKSHRRLQQPTFHTNIINYLMIVVVDDSSRGQLPMYPLCLD